MLYLVESEWSNEYVIAGSIAEAIEKYERRNHKISVQDRTITNVRFLGEVIK